MAMLEFMRPCLGLLLSVFRSGAALQAENLALRNWLCVYQLRIKKPKVQPAGRIPWSFLAKVSADCRQALIFVKPETAIRWQRRQFREH